MVVQWGGGGGMERRRRSEVEGEKTVPGQLLLNEGPS